MPSVASHEASLGRLIEVTLPHAGRRSAQVRLSEARQTELVANYQKTVQVAFREVSDAQITAEVKALLDRHPELGTSINVQTLDHVVYLYGLVDTPLDAEIANSVALQAPGATRVVSSIANGN